MTEQIFESKLKLKYLKNEIEEKYRSHCDTKLINSNKAIIFSILIASIADTILNSCFIDNNVLNEMFQTVLITTYLTTCIMITFTFIAIFSKNIKLIRWIHYFTYFILVFIFVNFRYTIFRVAKINTVVFYFLVIIEITIRLIWVIIGLQSFLECLMLNGMSIVFMWALYPPVFPKEIFYDGMINYMVYSTALLVCIVFSYVLDRQQKLAFYFNWVAEKKAAWLASVFENMNAGFISIRGDTITYINSFLLKQFYKIKRNKEKNNNALERQIHVDILNSVESARIRTDSNALIQDKDTTEKLQIDEAFENLKIKNPHLTNEILFNLLSNLNTESISDKIVQTLITNFQHEISNLANHSNIIDIFLQTFVKHISLIPNIQNFILIGDCNFLIDDSEINYEIHCRYYNSGNQGELEILFNDVTRTKFNEKQNAEFKYKTLFLSKVAHEFKNPLICINELINQSFDCFPYIGDEGNVKKMLNKTFFQIKSLSNFLLVMVRDLNYFSECQLGKDTTLDKKETDLKEIIGFCKDVTQSLIKRSGKSDNLDLIVQIDNDVPEKIMTDEWRLKQVIINLLSNSVKFTLFGQILLIVSKEKVNDKFYIKFTVKDTGVGIKEEQQKNIFKPFQKGQNKNNEMGSGLGLSIAYEISSKLGKNLQFSSKIDNGSVFWFSLPYEPTSNLHEKNKNSTNCFENELKRSGSKDYYNLGSEGRPEIFLNSKFELNDSESVKTRKLDEFVLTNKNIDYVSRNLIRNRRQISFDSKKSNVYKLNSKSTNLIESCNELNFLESPNKKVSAHSNLMTIPINHTSTSETNNKFFNRREIKFWSFKEKEDKISNLKNIEHHYKNFYISHNRNLSLNNSSINSQEFYSSHKLKKKEKANDFNPTKNNNKFSVEDFIFNNVSNLRKIENMQIFNININNIQVSKSVSSVNEKIGFPESNYKSESFINVILVDDELLTRQATARSLQTISRELKIKINIIEAEDGIETIYLVYKAMTQGVRISIIFSDENMNFMNGTSSSEILNEILTRKCMAEIPFYLVTANDNTLFNKYVTKGLTQILPKPITREVAKNIISKLIN